MLISRYWIRFIRENIYQGFLKIVFIQSKIDVGENLEGGFDHFDSMSRVEEFILFRYKTRSKDC